MLATVVALWLVLAAPVAGQSPDVNALATLPVYKLDPPTVTPDTALNIGNRFNQLGGQVVISRTTFRGTDSLAVLNPDKQLVFEQFGGSGGFNAFHQQAFGDGSVKGPLNADDAKSQACNFLQSRQLFPSVALFTDCATPGSQLPYQTIIARSTILTPAVGAGNVSDSSAISSTQDIGIIVQVPLGIRFLRLVGSPTIPLGGPGGHLSLLFVSTDPHAEPLLDNDYPGLAAVAEPWFERQRDVRGNYPVVPMTQAQAQATQRLKQEFVGASAVDPGTPELTYWVEEAEAEQKNMMPVWLFEHATATVDGQTFTARGFTLPAVEGFLPDVQITSPPNGTQFWAGRPFTLTGQIQGGNGPYSYRWLLDDDTVLGSGDTNGPAQLVTSNLPFLARDGGPADIVVRLEATDQNDATASAGVTLLAGPRQVFLPTIARAGANASAAGGVSIAAPPYRMGVEWVQYYNGHGADLPGTPGDANGFYNGLAGLGWSGVFKWSNNSAWEKDWKECSLGGADCTYGVDRADFAYFAGHGSVARIYFGVNKDAYNFYGGNARYQNLRWVAFSSCNTIRGTDISHWFNAFRGAHMLLGFHSVMADIAFGGPLVDRMKLPRFWIPFIGWQEFPSLQPTIRDAWVQTAFAMNAGRPAYIYAVGTNGVNPANNKLPKASDGNLPRPFPVASWHWVWWSLPGD
jgi:hypothetical protein